MNIYYTSKEGGNLGVLQINLTPKEVKEVEYEIIRTGEFLNYPINTYFVTTKKNHIVRIFDVEKQSLRDLSNMTNRQITVIRALSPDGFDIYFNKFYCSMEAAKHDLEQWVKQYEHQGYYSDMHRNRIPYDEIADNCKFVKGWD